MGCWSDKAKHFTDQSINQIIEKMNQGCECLVFEKMYFLIWIHCTHSSHHWKYLTFQFVLSKLECGVFLWTQSLTCITEKYIYVFIKHFPPPSVCVIKWYLVATWKGKGGAGRKRGQIFVLGRKYLLQMNVRRQFWLLWCEQENRERLWGCVGEFCCWHNASGICLEVVRGNGIANSVCLWQLCKLLGRRFIRWMDFFFDNSSDSLYLPTCVVSNWNLNSPHFPWRKYVMYVMILQLLCI